MELDYKKIVGTINFQSKPNMYAIKCEIYNKLVKMRLANYKNTWIKNDCVKNECVKNDSEYYIIKMENFTLTLQDKILTMYTNDFISCDSQEYKYLLLILQTLN